MGSWMSAADWRLEHPILRKNRPGASPRTKTGCFSRQIESGGAAIEPISHFRGISSLGISQPLIRRLIGSLGVIAAFLVMASVFTPDPTRAFGPPVAPPGSAANNTGNDPDAGPSPDNSGHHGFANHSSVDPHEGLPLLGSLENNQLIIKVYGTSVGPRYSICDAQSGDTLGELLTAEQAHLLVPELDLSTIDFSAPTATPTLMMVEPTMHGGWSR